MKQRRRTERTGRADRTPGLHRSADTLSECGPGSRARTAVRRSEVRGIVGDIPRRATFEKGVDARLVLARAPSDDVDDAARGVCPVPRGGGRTPQDVNAVNVFEGYVVEARRRLSAG